MKETHTAVIEESDGMASQSSDSLETPMMDFVKESCLSIIIATVIGSAICVGVNGLFLSEYGTAKFEETVRNMVLPQLGSVLQLAVDTQLNGCHDHNADHKI